MTDTQKVVRAAQTALKQALSREHLSLLFIRFPPPAQTVEEFLRDGFTIEEAFCAQEIASVAAKVFRDVLDLQDRHAIYEAALRRQSVRLAIGHASERFDRARVSAVVEIHPGFAPEPGEPGRPEEQGRAAIRWMTDDGHLALEIFEAFCRHLGAHPDRQLF